MGTPVETKVSKKIPYLSGELPIVGSLPRFAKNRLELFQHIAQECGDVAGFHMGTKPTILFNKPEYVHSILVDHADVFGKPRVMEKGIPINGIFISKGEFHRRQRKLMAPIFQPRQIAAYANIMTLYAENTQQAWTDRETIDLKQQMAKLTMGILGKTLFDIDVLTETDALGAAFGTFLAFTEHMVSSPIKLSLKWPTPRNYHMRQTLQFVDKHIQHLIDERRAVLNQRSQHKQVEKTEKSKTPNDLLTLLLCARDQDGNTISDRQVINECAVLFVAGHETTTAALTWTWYLLCQHPQVYRKVQQEVDSVLQGRSPTYTDLDRLPYCLQVFKESMRLYPPAVSIFREALQDIEIDGYHIPKGTMVMLSPYTMHRKAEYYPEPEKFNPEHFSPASEQRLPRHAYIPFGAGPRICIGNHFALMEGHLVLATLAQRVTFALHPGQNIIPDMHSLVLLPKGAVPAMVKKRQAGTSESNAHVSIQN